MELRLDPFSFCQRGSSEPLNDEPSGALYERMTQAPEKLKVHHCPCEIYIRCRNAMLSCANTSALGASGRQMQVAPANSGITALKDSTVRLPL